VSFLRGRRAKRPWERGPSHTASTSQDIFDSIGTAPRGTDPFGLGGDVKMSSRTRNLLLAAAVPVVTVAVAWSLLPSGTGDVVDGGTEDGGEEITEDVGGPLEAPSPEPADRSGDPSKPAGGASDVAGRRGYALAVPELKGLPGGAAPGTRLELWVAWDPPVTKEPRVQRLLKDVILDEIIPPVVPEAPATAILSVPAKSVPDLLYGDRYGALSATMLAHD
jgi:hypothetical protein